MEFSLEGYLKELEYLVNIDSGTYDPGTKKIAVYFKDRFEALGWTVTERQLHEKVGACLEITNKAATQYDMLLIGHMDTVFANGTAAERPFSIKGNRAYGPGVVDMKASLLSVYHAVSQLQATGGLAQAAVCIALNSDEEISSKYSRPWLEELAGKSKYALVLEPARGDGSMVNTRRGVGRYQFDFHGVPSHSGVAPEKGVSAINELAHWIQALHGLTDYAKGTNLNVGVVKGGTTANTVAEYASALVDVRMRELDEVVKIEETIEELLAKPKTPGIKVEVSGGVTRPPMNPSPATLLLCDRVDRLAAELGIEFAWIATGGGSDANLTAALGVPSIDGLGPIGSLSHTVDEYLEIGSVEPRLRLLCAIIKDIAENG